MYYRLMSRSWGASYEKFWTNKNANLLKSGTHSGGAMVSIRLFQARHQGKTTAPPRKASAPPRGEVGGRGASEAGGWRAGEAGNGGEGR